MSEFETLFLPSTGLSFDGKELIREDDEGNRTFAFSCEQLQSLRHRNTIEWLGLVVVATGLMIGFVGYDVAQATHIRVFLYILAIPVAGFGALMTKGDTIVITTDSTTIRLDASDSTDIVEGFVASVNSYLKTPRVEN